MDFKVNKNAVLNKLDTTTVDKIPVRGLSSTGRKGEIILNSTNKQFYGWNGNEWILLSSGGMGQGMVFITEIVADGIQEILSFQDIKDLPFSTLIFIGWGNTPALPFGGTSTLYCRYNDDEGNNYVTQLNQSYGDSTPSTSQYPVISPGVYICEMSDSPNYTGNFKLMLPNWNNTAYFKTSKSFGGRADYFNNSFNSINMSTWNNPTSIKKVDFILYNFYPFPQYKSFTAGSTIRLYGI